MDIPDGDLVRLARDGDPAAFRLLIERHLPMAGSRDQDYSCTTEDGRVILTATAPEPAGFACLSQEIEPDDYCGHTVTFRADLRGTGVADRAGLVLRIPRQGWRPTPPDPWHDPENHFVSVAGSSDWTRHEVTAQVPADAISIIFGVYLNGRGQVELRNPVLVRHAQGDASQVWQADVHLPGQLADPAADGPRDRGP